jgi:hypothetical protein
MFLHTIIQSKIMTDPYNGTNMVFHPFKYRNKQERGTYPNADPNAVTVRY